MKFVPVGMRAKIDALPGDLIVNTCSENDTDARGDATRWSWSNPTNRAYQAVHSADRQCVAVSIECLWQGTKAIPGRPCPDPLTLAGDWRRGKAKRPTHAYGGSLGNLTDPGSARRAIYIPAFEFQIKSWIREDEVVRHMIEDLTNPEVPGTVYLRDHDTGQGVDRRGPMSHAWVLSVFLNTGSFPK